MLFLLAHVGALSLLLLLSSVAPAVEPTARESAIAAAAAQGRTEDQRSLLEGEKPSPAALANALVGAARSGHADIVKVLLARGADVERPSTAYGMTALNAAVRHGHQGVAEELFRGGAKPTTTEQMAALGLDHELAAAIKLNPMALESDRCDETRLPLLHIAAAHGRIT